jgi:addiction module RelE/StbE family toxin
MTDMHWSALARADLLDIVDYISDDNPVAALQVLDDINTKVGQLAYFPQSGRLGRVEGTRELVVLANYVVVYQENAIAPRVLRVLHAAQQWPSTPE